MIPPPEYLPKADWPFGPNSGGGMIYLVSTSPRRKVLLKKAGVAFRILKPDYEENQDLKGTPSQIVKAHATGKAQSRRHQIKDGVLLSADTIVYLKGEIIGKPKNRKKAEIMLGKLQGRWHCVYTGVSIYKIAPGRVVKKTVFFEKTQVRLKALTAKGIKNYFKTVNPLDKAGAYAIQSPHGGIVQEVKGSFSNAVGLPMEKLLSHPLFKGILSKH